MSLTEKMKQALHGSVAAEQEAHDFYADAATKVKNDALAELFEQLAKDELGHRRFLEKLLEEDRIDVTIRAQKDDFRIAEEVIEDKPALTTDMPFDEALALAIKREQEAMDTYDELAADAGVEGDGELKDLFVNLRNMEQSHKTRLEQLYLNVAYTEVW